MNELLLHYSNKISDVTCKVILKNELVLLHRGIFRGIDSRKGVHVFKGGVERWGENADNCNWTTIK